LISLTGEILYLKVRAFCIAVTAKLPILNYYKIIKETAMRKNLTRDYTHAIRGIPSILGISRTEQLRKLKRSQYVNMAIGISLGAAIGVTTGLLLAPQSGRGTRDQLRREFERARSKLEKEPHFQEAVKAAKMAEDTTKAMKKETKNFI
jgi:hypothetical protein